MQIPLSQVKNSLLSKVGGRAQSNIPNLYSLMQETVWMMQTRADLPSSIRIEPFVNPLYGSTGTIILPDDFSLDGLIAIRPQDITTRTPYNSYINANQWNTEQLLYTSTIGIQNGVQYLNTRYILPAPIVLAELDDLTDEGTFTAVGATTDIRVDSQFYINGDASIAFTAGVGSSNGVELGITTAVDISDSENVMVWANLPAADASVRLSVGSSDGDYYYQNITASYFNQPLKTGWNLLRLDISAAEVIGSPDLAAVNYMKFEPLATLAAAATYRIDGLVATGDTFVNLEYYSNQMFVNSSGQRISIPTSDTDSLLMNEKEYMLFLRQFSEIANTDVRPTGAATQLAVYGGAALTNMYEQFQIEYPSRRILQADDYSSGRSGSFYPVDR